MSYMESKMKIDSIRKKDETMFYMAIIHMLDVGTRHLTSENVKATCKSIMKDDDSHSFMTNGYKCDLVRMAAQLAEINQVDMIVYIQREMAYDVGDGAPSYDRLKDALSDYISDDLMSYTDNGFVCSKLNTLGIDYDAWLYLGFPKIDDEEE